MEIEFRSKALNMIVTADMNGSGEMTGAYFPGSGNVLPNVMWNKLTNNSDDMCTAYETWQDFNRSRGWDE